MRRFLLPGMLGALALAYPLLTAGSAVYQRLGALVLLAAIGASAWNLIGGYAGQVSVGHTVFFGAGAYAAIAGYTHFGLPPIAGAPIGALVAILIAALIGVPTLRLSGHYFSMATIAVAELMRVLIINWEWVGGAQGISGPAVPRTVLDLSFISAMPYYYIFLAVLGAILFLTWRIEESRMGFYLRAIKDSERAARSLGVAAGRYKLYAYMLSAGLTAVAGSLYAIMFGFIDPESGFGILISVKMLIMAALGGCRSAVRAAGRSPDPGAARGDLQQPAGRQGRRPDLRRLWRHHRHHRPLPAERTARPVRGPRAAEAPEARAAPCCLTRAT